MAPATAPTVQAVPIAAGELTSLTYILPAGIAAQLQREINPVLTRLYSVEVPASFDLATWDSSDFKPPFKQSHGPADPWRLQAITTADLKAVCWAVDHWTLSGRALAGGLIANPDGIRTLDLADLVGFDGSIPPAMRAVAGRLRSIGRRPFWNGNPSTKGHPRGQRLTVTGTTAGQVVRDVFEARYPELLVRADD